MALKYSQPEFYHFSEDSIELAKTLVSGKSLKVLDLCCGCGVVGLEFSRINKGKISQLDFLELQLEFSNHLETNIKNFLPQYIESSSYFKNLKEFELDKKWDVILCNPPYFKKGHGRPSSDPKKQICRTQETFEFQDLELFFKRFLNRNGKAYIVIRDESDINQQSFIIVKKLMGATIFSYFLPE